MDQNIEQIRNKRNMNWWWKSTIAVIVVFGLSLFAYGAYILILAKNVNEVKSQNTTIDDATWEKVMGTSDNYWLGAEDPRLVIVVFSDFACPYCRKSFPTVREIGTKYKDQVKIIFRDYPLLTDYSSDLALAARCAGEQDLFWHMHDKLFINQGVKTQEELISLARQIGADIDQFTACIDIRQYYPQIAQDYSDAKELGIKGTPTFYIGGQKLEGEIPRDLFIYLLDEFLK